MSLTPHVLYELRARAEAARGNAEFEEAQAHRKRPYHPTLWRRVESRVVAALAEQGLPADVLKAPPKVFDAWMEMSC